MPFYQYICTDKEAQAQATSLYRLRSCVLLTLSDFGTFSRKRTAFRKSKRPNISVHFRQSVESLLTVENTGIFRYNFWEFRLFLSFATCQYTMYKMAKNVGNKSKMSKIIPEFLTYVENLKNNQRFSTVTVDCRKSRNYTGIFDINCRFSKIPVHFCEILYRESSHNFWKIFDRPKVGQCRNSGKSKGRNNETPLCTDNGAPRYRYVPIMRP